VKQALVEAQEIGFAPVQMPATQVSVSVHRFPSLQATPSGAEGLLHCPSIGLQTPATWHWSDALHTIGLAPMHTPARQLSLKVQAFPSVQMEPSAAFGLLHCPFAGLQIPARWHWSDALHAMGFEPVHTPDWHESKVVQAFPSLHAVPFGRLVPTQRPERTSQVLAVWHCAFGVQVTPAQGVSGVNAGMVTGTPI
jgi:hypothetical protein